MLKVRYTIRNLSTGQYFTKFEDLVMFKSYYYTEFRIMYFAEQVLERLYDIGYNVQIERVYVK